MPYGLSASSDSQRQYHLADQHPIRQGPPYLGSSYRKRASAEYVPTPSLPDAVAARDHQRAIEQPPSYSSKHRSHHYKYDFPIALPSGSDANGRGGRALQGHDRDDVSRGMVHRVMYDVVKCGQTQNEGFRGSPHISRKLKHSKS